MNKEYKRNKDELRNFIINNNEIDMTEYLDEFEKQIQQDFLREVLPEEFIIVKDDDLPLEKGFTLCRQEIINNARDKGIEI